jgi:hypothetical protein
MLLVVMTTALWEMAVGRDVSAAEERDLVQVVSASTGLTVEAHGVDVVQILREVGVQVGFMVVAREAVYPAVDVSSRDASLEEVLQRLLRGENYTLVYRSQADSKSEGEGKLSKVVLLSPSTTLAATPAADLGRQQQERHQALTQNQENTPLLSDAQPADRTTAAMFSREEWRRLEEQETGNPLTDPVTINSLLETQALQAFAASSYAETQSTADQLSTENSSELPSERIQSGEEKQGDEQQNLAIMAQVAQRNVAALVESLAAATDAFFDAQASQKESGR